MSWLNFSLLKSDNDCKINGSATANTRDTYINIHISVFNSINSPDEREAELLIEVDSFQRSEGGGRLV